MYMKDGHIIIGLFDKVKSYRYLPKAYIWRSFIYPLLILFIY